MTTIPTKSNVKKFMTKEITAQNSIGQEFSGIPAGTFVMGSCVTEDIREDGEVQHQVTLTKPFLMGKTVVTQSQWRKVIGTEPWKGQEYVQEGDDYPATYIDWYDAVAFCQKLSHMEEKPYRLPTEAEWEYACRAGSKTVFSFGNDNQQLDQYAWFDGNAYDIDEKYAHRVSQKLPNAWGLYDMHGNVWEWCSDWYENEYKYFSCTDPKGPSKGPNRVLRGGSWFSMPNYVRCAYRHRSYPEYRVHNVGFRLVLG